jgi:nicotinamidase-related amidase
MMKKKQFLGQVLGGGIALSVALVAGGVFSAPAYAADVISEWASVKAPPPPALKAVTVDPKTTALLLMDFLPKFYCLERPRCVAVLPEMKKLLAAARASGTTVIYSIAGNFKSSDIAKEVAPIGNEPVVKAHADKFLDTDLDKLLKDKGIQTVIVTGTAGNGAVLYTGSEAALRGFKVIVPVDGLPSNNLYAEQLTVWQLANGPGFGKDVTITRSDMIKF